MGNPKRGQENFTPDHLGEKSVAVDANKGKKMADKTGQQPIVIQTKGE
ncbi:acid-soluble spore protein N [Siminovitchia acidinfaciens]|uniref:Small, acid-soluble spore protein N n=1 Tax=Siminovitchia acidinfaciens TaxID=2321395 RepID=A0A429XWZ0_9BACI|nr:acid-soluble spore protein N [Siminovitchia acidinfaciens]RST73011.1 acid-soluble spore protein N [Siminovitchia acidinfaciens]VEF48100.1 acid-soluble spore protein N [Bacillus freudenreichii]